MLVEPGGWMSEHHSGDHHARAGASRPYRRDPGAAPPLPSRCSPRRPHAPQVARRHLPERISGSNEDDLSALARRDRSPRCLRGSGVSGAPGLHPPATVLEGADPDPVVLQGEAATLLEVCFGRRSPVPAWRDRRLRLSGRRGVLVAAGAAFVLSLPAAFYGGRGTKRPSSRPVD